jgi:hypothetical protein
MGIREGRGGWYKSGQRNAYEHCLARKCNFATFALYTVIVDFYPYVDIYTSILIQLHYTEE